MLLTSPELGQAGTAVYISGADAVAQGDWTPLLGVAACDVVLKRRVPIGIDCPTAYVIPLAQSCGVWLCERRPMLTTLLNPLQQKCLARPSAALARVLSTS